MKFLLSKMLSILPLSSKLATGWKNSSAVWVTTFLLSLLRRRHTVSQWQHQIVNLKQPLPCTILLQVCWYSSRCFRFSMYSFSSLKAHPQAAQMRQDMTMRTTVPGTVRKVRTPAAPTAMPPIRMIVPISRGMCLEGSRFWGWLVWVKAGSRRLKNMAPKPLAIPQLQAEKLNAAGGNAYGGISITFSELIPFSCGYIRNKNIQSLSILSPLPSLPIPYLLLRSITHSIKPHLLFPKSKNEQSLLHLPLGDVDLRQFLGGAHQLHHAHQFLDQEEGQSDHQCCKVGGLYCVIQSELCPIGMDICCDQEDFIACDQSKQHFLAAIVQIEQPVPRFRFLVMRSLEQGDVHLVPMRHQIEHDIPQEHPRPLGVKSSQDGQHDPVRRPVAHHVQHRPEFGRLLEVPRGHAVEGVQELAESVAEECGQRMRAIERKHGEQEDKSKISDDIGNEEKDH